MPLSPNHARGRIVALVGWAGAAHLACTTPATEATKSTTNRVGEEIITASPGSSDDEATPPIAIVNGVAIPQTRFDALFALKRERTETRGRPNAKVQLDRERKRLVQRLVYSELVRQRAAQVGATVSEQALDTFRDERRRSMTNPEQALARRGENEASQRELDRTRLLVEAILHRTNAVEISEAEITATYERRRPRYTDSAPRRRFAQIVIEAPSKTVAAARGLDPVTFERLDAAARKNIITIEALARLPEADFATLARTHSQADNARHGGRMGILNRATLGVQRAFAFDLPTGKVSSPIRTEAGYELLVAYESYAPGPLPLSAVAEQIEARARHERQLAAGGELNRDLYRSATITYRLIPDPGPLVPIGNAKAAAGSRPKQSPP